MSLPPRHVDMRESNVLIRAYYTKHASIYQGLLPWLFEFPKIQSAGYPWTYQKIEKGLLLLEEISKGHGLLKEATAFYVGNKKAEQLTDISSSSEENSFTSVSSIEEIEKLTDNIDESEDEWIDILQEKEGKAIEIRCTCPFKSLVGYLSNDNIAVEHLKKIESGCVDIVMGDLHSIIANYRSFFESCIYIAKDIHMDEAAEQIRRILDGIPEKLAQIA